MTKIKLVDGSILDCEGVTQNGSTLTVVTKGDLEELKAAFKDSVNLETITLLTDGGSVSGTVEGFSVFRGISEGQEGLATVTLGQVANNTAQDLEEIKAAMEQNAADIEFLSVMCDVEL